MKSNLSFVVPILSHLVDKLKSRDKTTTFEPDLASIINRAVMQLIRLRADIFQDYLRILAGA